MEKTAADELDDLFKLMLSELDAQAGGTLFLQTEARKLLAERAKDPDLPRVRDVVLLTIGELEIVRSCILRARPRVQELRREHRARVPDLTPLHPGAPVDMKQSHQSSSGFRAVAPDELDNGKAGSPRPARPTRTK